MPVEYHYHTYLEFLNPILYDVDEYEKGNCEYARQFLVGYYTKHPEIEFIEAKIESDFFCQVDMSTNLSTKFGCTLVSDDEQTIIEARWFDSGIGSGIRCDFENIKPILSIDCVYENGKWYIIPASIVTELKEHKNNIYNWKCEYDRL